MYVIVKKFSKYAHNKLGIPFPLNVVVVLMFGFVVLYTAQKVRMALCRPPKKEEPIFNRIDAEDISLVIKSVKQIKE